MIIRRGCCYVVKQEGEFYENGAVLLGKKLTNYVNCGIIYLSTGVKPNMLLLVTLKKEPHLRRNSE